MPRSERLYLSDISEAAEAIQRYVAGRSFDEFVADDVLRRAVLQRLTEIGEASAHLSRDFRTRYPDIEWTDIVAFRNIAVHAYFAVNWQIVWVTATRDVPNLAKSIAEILNREYPPSPPAGAVDN